MADRDDDDNPGPECECGYRGLGDTVEARVRDAQRHALEIHGIEVTADQVRVHQNGGGT
jgi:hypothetical protein